MKNSGFLVLCGSSVLILSAAAQTPAPPASGPTARVTSSEVLLDFVVRDKHGKPVKNLKLDEVEIYEDGVRQEIKSFRFAGPRETRDEKLPSATAAVPASHRLRPVNLVCIVFHNLDPLARTRASEAVQEFLKNSRDPDTFVGMFRLEDNLTPIYPFSNNRGETEQAARNLFGLMRVDFAKASEAVVTVTASETDTVGARGTPQVASGSNVSSTVVAGADLNTGAGAAAAREAGAREQRDFSNVTGMREYDKINTMIKAFGTLPGRKSVLLVSTGFVTTGDPDLFESMISRANSSRITVYGLDIAGLNEVSKAQGANLSLGRAVEASRGQQNVDSGLEAMKERSRQGDTMHDAVRSSDAQASLRALAESTGGFLIANTNEYRKPFQHIAEDVDSHYEASYRPASQKYDGRLRSIAIKLARAGLTADSRTGYFAMPDLKGSAPLLPYETMGLAVLNAKPQPHAFDFRTGVLRFHNDGAHALGALVFELPGTSLSATAKPERGTQVLHASLLALVKDASGEIVDKFSVDAPYEIPDANLQTVRATPLTFTHMVSLPPGCYTLETAVMDREGKRASTGVVAFEAELPRGIGISSLTLIQRVERLNAPPDPSEPLIFHGNRIVPFLATALPAEAAPSLYFVVYPDRSNAEKPKFQVEFLVDGQVLANQTSDLPAPDASGAIPMVIRAATHTGTCELRITALQGSQSATVSVKYTIGAVGQALTPAQPR